MNMGYADNFRLLLNEKLCDLADAVMRYYDPCKKGPDSCLVADNISAGGTEHCCFHSDKKTACWLWRDGCQVRVISCKVWLCAPAAEKAHPDCLETMKDIERIALRYGLVRQPLIGGRYAGRAEQIEAARRKEGSQSK